MTYKHVGLDHIKKKLYRKAIAALPAVTEPNAGFTVETIPHLTNKPETARKPKGRGHNSGAFVKMR